MKVIKLDHRHNLKRKGFDWAFKFDGWSPKASTVEIAVRQSEGFHWNSTFWKLIFISELDHNKKTRC
jgi:hypothetical protein